MIDSNKFENSRNFYKISVLASKFSAQNKEKQTFSSIFRQKMEAQIVYFWNKSGSLKLKYTMNQI